MFRTSNPMLKEKTFNQTVVQGETMTLQGTVNKTVTLLALCVIGASWTWNVFYNQGPSAAMGYLWPSIIAAMIVGLITSFKQHLAPITAPIYAVLEGLFLGAISAFFEAMYPGIVIQAVALTFGTLFCLLMAYKSGLIKATENFKLGVAAATGAIFVLYMISMIGGMFGWNMPYLHESGVIGIGLSLVIVVVAALNLVLDFDFIENAEGKAPRYMEWYGAFGLLVTLAWLYIEFLRLLAKLRD